MISAKKILAIIPARGGSKGIPKKNVRFLAGKPLINYTIEAAKKSKHALRVVVSTDNPEIARVSKKAGAQIIDRPKILAQDHSPVQQAIDHAVEHLADVENYVPDIIVLLQPTSPLRTAQDIDQALELFLNNACESVVGVYEPGLLHASFTISKQYLKPIFGRKHLKERRQKIPKSYVPNGAIFISTPAHLSKYKSFYTKSILPYIMPKEKSVDIDDETDFMLVEMLILP